MSYIFFLLLAIAIGEIAPAAANAQILTPPPITQESTLNDYWPLNDGDQSLFIVDGFGINITVTGTGGGNFNLIQEAAGHSMGVITIHKDTVSNLYSLVAISSGTEVATFNPPVRLFGNEDVESPGTVSSQSDMMIGERGYPCTMHLTLSNAGTVTVPAGTFSYCRNLTLAISLNDLSSASLPQRLFSFCLAPGAGIIKVYLSHGAAKLVTGAIGANPIAPVPDGSAPGPGRYTLLITSTETSGPIPQGSGYGIVTLTPAGVISVAGRLPDNEPFHSVGLLAGGITQNQFLIEKDLVYPDTAKGDKGFIGSTLIFSNAPGISDVTGIGYFWEHPNLPGRPYNLFTTGLSVIGSRYTPPTKGGSILPGFISGTIQLSDSATLSPSGSGTLSKNVILNSQNRFLVTDPGSDRLSLSVDSKNGNFSGTFLYPGRNRTISFAGVLFQDQTCGAGFFIGPAGSGSVLLKPQPRN